MNFQGLFQVEIPGPPKNENSPAATCILGGGNEHPIYINVNIVYKNSYIDIYIYCI